MGVCLSFVLLSCGNKVFNELIHSWTEKLNKNYDSKDDDGED